MSEAQTQSPLLRQRRAVGGRRLRRRVPFALCRSVIVHNGNWNDTCGDWKDGVWQPYYERDRLAGAQRSVFVWSRSCDQKVVILIHVRGRSWPVTLCESNPERPGSRGASSYVSYMSLDGLRVVARSVNNHFQRHVGGKYLAEDAGASEH